MQKRKENTIHICKFLIIFYCETYWSPEGCTICKLQFYDEMLQTKKKKISLCKGLCIQEPLDKELCFYISGTGKLFTFLELDH